MVSALFALLILKEKTPSRIYVAAFFVFIGLYIIFADDLGTSDTLGNMFALGAVVCLSFLLVTLSRYKQASRIAYISLGGLFLSLFCALSMTFSISPMGLFFVALMGIVVTPFSRILIGMGTQYIIPAQVGLMIIAESVLAPFWGWWWLDEVPSHATFIGGSIIVMTIALNAIVTLRHQ